METLDPTTGTRWDGEDAYVASLERLAAVLVSETDLDRTLELVLEAAASTVPGAAAASVSVRGERDFVTLASSHDDAIALDHIQYRWHEGPCIEALVGGAPCQVDDLRTETRWPRFREDAGRYGLRSILAVPLEGGGEVIGGLNVFADEPHAFDTHAGELAARLSVPAAAALLNLSAYQRATELAEQFERAMASRSVIEQAKGIVIARRRCDADAAFEVLKSISQRTNRKLRDVAHELVELHGGIPAADDGT